MTKEMLSDRVGRMVENEPLLVGSMFNGFSDTQISAILLYGARKEELALMLENLELADSSRKVNL